jgi:hypothetical protein
MTSLIEALDEVSKIPDKMQLGENSHIEYKWSENDIQEQIMQLYFQLVRTVTSQMDTLGDKFETIVKNITTLDTVTTQKYISIVLRLVCQTRDIVAGKGEYALSYMMLLQLSKYFPDFVEYALEKFVQLEDGKQPYGSWKDIKYIACLCRTKHMKNGEFKAAGLRSADLNSRIDARDTFGISESIDIRITKKCIELVNNQLAMDLDCTDDKDISLCAKWVPREGSKKHGWFFKLLAMDFFKENNFMSMSMALTDESLLKAKKKCYTKYRKLLSKLNGRIDTVQIKQCGNNWASIDHNRTTSITISRNKKAFLNVKKDGDIRSFSTDRIQCAENFKKYIESRIKSGKEVKGGRIGLNHFTRQALELIKVTEHDENTQIEKALLNSQWRSNSTQNDALKKMIAMVDVSSSMEGEPMEVAIALGIRVAEKSLLGKRVLTFSSSPTWHNLEKNNDFISMVESLRRAGWGASTNFYSALDMILKSLIEKQVPPEDTEGLIFAIFSDMQINDADSSFKKNNSMIDYIKNMYQLAGYPCPHILFWNLRSTDGFPTLSVEKGSSMMSGFSPVLLNLFCEKGLEALQEATPWNMMIESLKHERYTCLDEYVSQYYSTKIEI